MSDPNAAPPRAAPPREKSSTSIGQLGMVVLLISISVIFVAACLAVIITRHQVTTWRAPGSSGLPVGTLASTLLIGVVSWQLQSALRAIRSNNFTLCSRCLRWAGGAALAFLFAQAINARQLLLSEGPLATRALFVFSYDLLVGLHAVHVVGGFVPLAIVLTKVQHGDYSSSRHSGLLFCVQYWHYLAVMWLLLLGTLSWVALS